MLKLIMILVLIQVQAFALPNGKALSRLDEESKIMKLPTQAISSIVKLNISFTTQKNEVVSSFCSGVFLSPTLLLSAKHCFLPISLKGHFEVQFIDEMSKPIITLPSTALTLTTDENTVKNDYVLIKIDDKYHDLLVARGIVGLVASKDIFLPGEQICNKVNQSNQYRSKLTPKMIFFGFGKNEDPALLGKPQYLAATIRISCDEFNHLRTDGLFADRGDSGGPLFLCKNESCSQLILTGLVAGGSMHTENILYHGYYVYLGNLNLTNLKQSTAPLKMNKSDHFWDYGSKQLY